MHKNTHQNTQQFSDNPLPKIVRINGVDVDFFFFFKSTIYYTAREGRL